MALFRTLACMGIAASGVAGSCATCLSQLDDGAAFVQRGTLLKEFESHVGPSHKISLLESNHFKNLVSNINSAMDSVKDDLETRTREVVRQAVAEMKELVAASTAEPVSLLDLAAGSAHKPKLEANATHNATHSGKKKHKKAKSEWNPFKDLISGINQAIDVVKDGIETTTKEIVHESAAELSQMGKELSQELEAMQKDMVSAASTASAPPASLLSIGESDAHKPKINKLKFQVNATSNMTLVGKHKKHKANKTKIEFNPFKEMISSINGAIDSIKDNLETSAHDLVHSAVAELEQAGKELKSDLDQTLKQTMREAPIVTVAPSSQ